MTLRSVRTISISCSKVCPTWWRIEEEPHLPNYHAASDTWTKWIYRTEAHTMLAALTAGASPTASKPSASAFARRTRCLNQGNRPRPATEGSWLLDACRAVLEAASRKLRVLFRNEPCVTGVSWAHRIYGAALRYTGRVSSPRTN